MTADEIRLTQRTVREKKPLIHCITNPISITQCANAILAVGARPIMAEHPAEVAEITETAQALVLNLGNITDVRMESMRISAAAAERCGIPVVIDAVGIACSRLRREFLCSLLETVHPAVIKGNYSEIHALQDAACRSSGVDADAGAEVSAVRWAAEELTRKYGGVILASGAVDVVTDGRKTLYLRNGTPQLAQITGTGCMLGALCGCYAAATYVNLRADLGTDNALRADLQGITAAAAACTVLGIAGELAQTDAGSGTFFMRLMDNLSVMGEEDFKKYGKWEEISVESSGL